MAFLDGDNFCKAFAGAQVNLSYHEWRSLEVRSLNHFWIFNLQILWRSTGSNRFLRFLSKENGRIRPLSVAEKYAKTKLVGLGVIFYHALQNISL